MKSLGLASILFSICVSDGFAQSIESKVEFFQQPPFVLGQPLGITITLTNNSSNAVTINLGKELQANIHGVLQLPNGSIASKTDVYKEGLSIGGNVEISPLTRIIQRYLLSDWFDIAQPGKYLITLAIPASGLGANGEPVLISQPGAISFTMESEDQSKLRLVCGQLLARLDEDPSHETATFIARMLATITDPLVVPYLLATAKKERITDAIVLSALHKYPDDVTAIEALIDFSSSDDFVIAGVAKGSLKQMQITTRRPELRLRINLFLESR